MSGFTGSVVLLLLLLCCLPLAVLSLQCYSCVFPAISPLDCLKFPQECPEGQRCLSSEAVAVRGSITIVLHEKSCTVESQCGISGEKHAAGLNFTYANECCDTDLCNSAMRVSAPCWRDLLLGLTSITIVLLLA